MTREQAAQLVAILVGHYPSAKFTRENAQVWTDTLQELDAERTHEAVRELVRKEKWMPSLAHIFEIVTPPRPELPRYPYFGSSPEEIAEDEAAARKMRRLSKGALRALPAPRKPLPPDQAKALMLLEEAEAKGELTDEQREELAQLKKASGQ